MWTAKLIICHHQKRIIELLFQVELKFVLRWLKMTFHCVNRTYCKLSKVVFTGFPAFQGNKIPWLFPDEVSKFYDNYCWNFTPHFQILFLNTIIALCTHRTCLWKKIIITCFCRHAWCTNKPIKISWLFPDLRHFSQIPWLFPH